MFDGLMASLQEIMTNGECAFADMLNAHLLVCIKHHILLWSLLSMFTNLKKWQKGEKS